jgi:hypothetical protein
MVTLWEGSPEGVIEGQTVHRAAHILLLHHSENERLRHIAGWFGAGLANEEKVLYVDVAGWGPDVLVPGLARHGFDVAIPVTDGQLEFVELEDFLLMDKDGHFPHLTSAQATFPGVRLALRCDAVAAIVGPDAHVAIERRLAGLCHTERVSVLCQYDGRTTRDHDLALALDLHPDWIYEADLSMHRRGHVIRVAGELDTLDGEILVRSLRRMTKELDADRVLALDLRSVDGLTLGACRALLEGTRAFRERSGRVRCGVPPGSSGQLLRTSVSAQATNFELA